jgi:predicted nuclease with TOPRIM domain
MESLNKLYKEESIVMKAEIKRMRE